MNYHTSVLLDQHGNPLNGSTDPAAIPEVLAINQLEESWTPQKLATHNKDYVTLHDSTTIEFDLDGTWRYLRGLYYFRGPVKNVVNNLSMLTGMPEITFEKDADSARWADVSEENNFPIRWGEIIHNVFLFNDYFTYLPHNESGGTMNDGGGKKKITVRNFEPFMINKIETVDGDPEDITKYCSSTAKRPEYSPAEIVHHKLNQIGNTGRGVPLLSACLRELTYYYKWMEDLYYMGHIRARLPVVRKVKGGSSQVEAEAARHSYLPGPGRMPVENMGVEYQYPPAYSGMTDAEMGINVFLRGVALTVNLPVFLVSSDYTNNSLASTLSADSPTVRLIRWYRTQFAQQFKQVIHGCIGEVDMTIDWPPVIERNRKEEAEAYAIGVGEGALSSQDMCTDVYGKNWEEVKVRRKAESDAAAAEWRGGDKDTGYKPA